MSRVQLNLAQAPLPAIYYLINIFYTFQSVPFLLRFKLDLNKAI
jgi:hypothetical protein